MAHLLIDPQLGPHALAGVAGALGDEVVVRPASPVRTPVGALQAESELDELLNGGASWGSVVGFGHGASVAAGLVAAGRAESAVLVDPPHIVAGDRELAAAHRADRSGERLTRGVAALPPGAMDADPRGPFPDAFYLAAAIQLTDDPRLQAEYARVWRAAEEERQPYDLGLGLQPRDPERLNWLSTWKRPDLDTTVWLSQDRDAFARALRARAPGRPLVEQPWGALVWLFAPEQLASALATVLGHKPG
ncbi:MAG: hypothetical protein KDB60_06885 [Propionibacteriaceae bacterium]|nr:hypothetical protein [Propionibacteriaceae bacterium]